MSFDHPDMSAFLPADLPDDWAQAQIDNINAATLTFSTAKETLVSQFGSVDAVMRFSSALVAGFEYSPSRNAVRVNGDVMLLPEPAVARRRVDASECTLFADGHRPHWIPALRAANGPEADWIPVTAIAVTDQCVTFRAPNGTFDAYNHDPERLASAVEYHPRWGILRGPCTGGARSAFSMSTKPVTPCTA